MHDLGRRHSDDLTRNAKIRDIARMAAQKMIRNAPANQIEFNALPDNIAARQGLVPIERQHLRWEHLQLQRH